MTTVVRAGEVDLGAGDVVLVDRRTEYGNRFTHERAVAAYWNSIERDPPCGPIEFVPDRDAAVTAHRIEFLQRLASTEGQLLREWLRSIRGKRLACHCHPLPCHADTYAELADMGSAELGRLAAMYAQ